MCPQKAALQERNPEPQAPDCFILGHVPAYTWLREELLSLSSKAVFCVNILEKQAQDKGDQALCIETHKIYGALCPSHSGFHVISLVLQVSFLSTVLPLRGSSFIPPSQGLHQFLCGNFPQNWAFCLLIVLVCNYMLITEMIRLTSISHYAKCFTMGRSSIFTTLSVLSNRMLSTQWEVNKCLLSEWGYCNKQNKIRMLREMR